MSRHDEIKNAYQSLGGEATFYGGIVGMDHINTLLIWNSVSMRTTDVVAFADSALFKVFCKSSFRDEVRDFKIPEPEAVTSYSVSVSTNAAPAVCGGLALTGYRGKC